MLDSHFSFIFLSEWLFPLVDFLIFAFGIVLLALGVYVNTILFLKASYIIHIYMLYGPNDFRSRASNCVHVFISVPQVLKIANK